LVSVDVDTTFLEEPAQSEDIALHRRNGTRFEDRERPSVEAIPDERMCRLPTKSLVSELGVRAPQRHEFLHIGWSLGRIPELHEVCPADGSPLVGRLR
jgi:hypothetical protein